MKNTRAVAAALALAMPLLTSVPSAAADKDIVGQWCDRPIPNLRAYDNTMTIYTEGSKAFLHRNIKGDVLTQPLRKKSNTYFAIESHTGDRYRVTSKGLEIADNEGLIRTASPGKCP